MSRLKPGHLRVILENFLKQMGTGTKEKEQHRGDATRK